MQERQSASSPIRNASTGLKPDPQTPEGSLDPGMGGFTDSPGSPTLATISPSPPSSYTLCHPPHSNSLYSATAFFMMTLQGAFI